MKRWELILLSLVLLTGAFCRLYRIPQYLTFLGDEGRDAIVMRNIMTAKHFPLIGPGTSIGNMYLGPWYYYLIAPSLALFNFSPVGPAVAVATVGIATIALLWWVGRSFYGTKISLLISLLYAISPTVITYSRSSWNPNVMPFFALLCIYGLWLVWTTKTWKWLIVTTVSFAFALNSHYLGLLLLPVIILFTALSIISQKDLRGVATKSITISIVTFFILLSPLLLFDLRHNWQNFTAIKTFFSQRQTTVNIKVYKAIPELWPITTDVVSSLLTAKQSTPGQVLTFAMLGFSIILLFKRHRNFLFTGAWLLIGLVGLGLYKQHIYDHYYGFIFPAVFIILGFIFQYLFSLKYLKVLAFGLIFYLIYLNLSSSPLRYPPNQQMTRTSQVADFIISQSGGHPFNLALLAKSNYDSSYRYFIDLKSKSLYTLQDRTTQQLFVVCEQAECNPIGHPLWEIAAFGWAKLDQSWTFPWGVKLFKLVPNLLL